MAWLLILLAGGGYYYYTHQDMFGGKPDAGPGGGGSGGSGSGANPPTTYKDKNGYVWQVSQKTNLEGQPVWTATGNPAGKGQVTLQAMDQASLALEVDAYVLASGAMPTGGGGGGGGLGIPTGGEKSSELESITDAKGGFWIVTQEGTPFGISLVATGAISAVPTKFYGPDRTSLVQQIDTAVGLNMPPTGVATGPGSAFGSPLGTLPGFGGSGPGLGTGGFGSGWGG